MNKFFHYLSVCGVIVFSGCSAHINSLSPDKQAVYGLATKATIVLADDGSDENNILIRDGVKQRLYKNSIFEQGKNNALSIEIFVRPTFRNHGVNPVVVEWKDSSGNSCLIARYPVVYDRCHGGRSLCVYVTRADELKEQTLGCSRDDLKLALADSSILHNSNADAFDVIDTYKDEAFDRLSK